MKKQQQRVEHVVRGGLHVGGSLQHLVSKYPAAPQVLKELVQNGIDMGAKSIVLVVDLDRGVVTYHDNGNGASPDDFYKAVATIGKSVKPTDKYGRFGIGLVSPLSISEYFTFISAPKGQRYREWSFDRKVMFAATESFPIPERASPAFAHQDGATPRHFRQERVWWRTQVLIERITTDKAKRRLSLEDLAYEIQAEFSAHMLKLGATVKLELIEGGVETSRVVRGKEFEGKALPVWEKTFDDVGKVTMRMYLAPTGYTGKLRMSIGAGGNPSRINMQTFISTDAFRCLGDRVKEVLKSGMFQGEIVGEKLEMQANRKSFAIGDATLGLAIALEEWYKDVGAERYTDEKGKRRRERLQALGHQVLDKLRGMFTEDSPFASVITRALFGSVGKHHAELKATEVPGIAPMTGLTETSGVTKGDGESGDESEGSSRGRHKPAHMPKVAIGPKGGERRPVKGHSAGPHIQFGDDEDSNCLWRFNPQALHLYINCTHPTFVAVERSEYKTKALIEFILLTAFQVECQDADGRAAAEVFAASLVDNYVEMLLLQGTISRT